MVQASRRATGPAVGCGRSIREASCRGAARRAGAHQRFTVRSCDCDASFAHLAHAQSRATMSPSGLFPPGRDCQDAAQTTGAVRRRLREQAHERSWQRALRSSPETKGQRGAPRAAARFTSEPARGAPKNSSLFQYQHKLRMRQHRHSGPRENAGGIATPWPVEIVGILPFGGDFHRESRFAFLLQSTPEIPRNAQTGQCRQPSKLRLARSNSQGRRRSSHGPSTRNVRLPSPFLPNSNARQIIPVAQTFPKVLTREPPIPQPTCWFPGGRPRR